MRLIVGLGNPGKEYENTRHNIGFEVLDLYAKKNNYLFDKKKFSGLYFETKINDEKVIFLKPQKFMNLSGEVVRAFVNYFKIPIENILIIEDDLDLPVGIMKLKEKGSSGGHNGLKNIEENLGTINYHRLKIGISKNSRMDTKNYVLGKFNESEKKIINGTILKAEEALEDYFNYDFNKLMSKYN